MAWFLGLPLPLQGLCGGLLALLPAACGAAAVFPLKNLRQKYLDGALGFAGGIMVAAAFYSLLNPAYQQAAALHLNPLLPVVGGFGAGVLFLALANIFLPPEQQSKENRQSWGLLYFAMTLHNIPEGLAIGVAIGAAADGEAMAAALALALGIGIQNFPEGAAIALPLRRSGKSPLQAFGLSQLSALAETAAAMAGAVLTVIAVPLLPFILAFAAGAMVFVVFGEIIPEAHSSGNQNTVALLSALGFTVMMFFDLCFA